MNAALVQSAPDAASADAGKQSIEVDWKVLYDDEYKPFCVDSELSYALRRRERPN